ncbi:MAG: class I SAM-dependent methyltransferase [Paracoccaceae bacterium]|nr:class I SAM-dependent methyltransferase [Paracoccaceae bacterium]
MTGFSADWLALRAGADRRARDPGLAKRLSEIFSGRDRLRVLDIGSGTGANMRATAPLIEASQHWVLADNDASLLARAEAPAGVTFETRRVDLAADLATLFDPAPNLVTASAFFDLCGADWLSAFVTRLAEDRAIFYTVLTYDGRETWLPPHHLDAAVLDAFHADQRRDKGLGPALGPEAHSALAGLLKEHGFGVFEAQSDWDLQQPRDAALISALAEGGGAATAAIVGPEIDGWMAARRDASAVTIGHRDLLAVPPR